VIIPSDIFHAYPEVWPFSAPFAEYHANAAKPLPLPVFSGRNSEKPTPGKHLQIKSIFVYNDPRDMGLDSQLVLDLLLSHQGFLGTHSQLNGRKDLPNAGYQQDDQPPLQFANPDLVWAAKWHLPRLGSGGFKATLEGLWHAITAGKAKLSLTMGGKPSNATFQFAEDKLVECRKTVLQKLGSHTQDEILNVYMVGDNPASDIEGANMFRSARGTKWTSILVRSGVWAGEEPPEEKFRPKVTVDGVFDAVNWGLEREGLEKMKL
jgi:ribonucleotide monophosphatase NagD (HAD superfamily)